MGLTYQELLSKIEVIVEKNINEKDAKLNDKLNDRFSQLSTEINELKRANAQLTKINKRTD